MDTGNPSGCEARPRIVAGFGRSGTTWVQDVVAEANRLRPVFEPLHPMHVPGAAPFSQRLVLEDDPAPELHAFFSRYFHEEFHSLWADYRLERVRLLPRPRELLLPGRLSRTGSYWKTAGRNFLRYRPGRRHAGRLVKCVRANMMLGWLKKNFRARIVFLVRHPGAVVASQLRSLQAWRPERTVERYRQDAPLVDTLAAPVRERLFAELSDPEALTLSWCIENGQALQQAARHGIPIVWYEHLVRAGLPEWERILAALELAELPAESLIARPSQQAMGDKAADEALVRQYGAWTREIDRQTAARMQDLLEVCGITYYRMDSLLPKGDRPEARRPVS